MQYSQSLRSVVMLISIPVLSACGSGIDHCASLKARALQAYEFVQISRINILLLTT